MSTTVPTRPSNGGITKRSGNPRPPRMDRDGDLDMDSPQGGRGGRNRRRGGRGGRGGGGGGRGGRIGTSGGGGILKTSRRDPIGNRDSRGSRSTNGPTLVSVQVVGWKDSKGTMEECVQFLERKTSVKINKTQKHGDVLLVYVPPRLVEILLEWDNALFAGVNLKISSQLNDVVVNAVAAKVSDGGGFDPKEIEARLGQVLNNRYTAVNKLLDLSKLGEDAILRESGFFDLNSTTQKMFPVLMVVADKRFVDLQAKREAVSSVSLAFNGLTSLAPVTEIAKTFPDIENLSLEGNCVPNLKALERWKGKFRRLQHLLLIGNPITNEKDYKNVIMRWFPNLTMLDNLPLVRPEIFDKPTASGSAAIIQNPSTAVDANGRPILPMPARQNFMGGDAQAIIDVNRFLEDFFRLYDTDRAKIIDSVYTDQSVFSLNVNTSSPRVKEQEGVRQYWDAYIPESRNLKRIDPHGAAAQNRLHVGRAAIAMIWKKLPETCHELNNTELWSIDVVQLPDQPNVYMAAVQGEFDEPQKLAPNGVIKRSFTRVFYLHFINGNVKVLNEMLTLRSYAGHKAWQEQPIEALAAPGVIPAVAPAIPVAAAPPPLVPAVQAPLTPEQQQLVAQLSEQTGMNSIFSAWCLTETSWSLADAWIAYVNAKDAGVLGPEAFTQSV